MSARVPALPTRASRRGTITANAWGIDPTDPQRGEQIRPLDFLTFAAFGFPSVQAPGIGLPINELLPLALCLVCLGRPGTSPRTIPPWFVCGLVAVVGWLGLTSYLHDYIDPRRLLHLVLYAVLSIFLGSGRIHLRSAAYGLCFGLSTSILAAIAGLGGSSYSGRLVGFFGDPNGGGYVMTTFGTIALGLLPRGRARLVLMVLVPIAVVMTFSRTTLLALTFSIIWLLVGRRVNVLVGSLLALGMVYIVGHIPAQLKLFGPFADRKGSDELRERIIAQEHLDISKSPLTGSGAGTAHVMIGPDQFFYHSSYLALQREGGQIAQVLLLGTMALVFVVAISRRRDLRNPWLEVSLICVTVCAVNLGEVLLELPATVAMGVVVHHLLNLPRAEAPPEPDVGGTQVGRHRPGVPVSRRHPARQGPRP